MIEASTQFMVGKLSTESAKCNSFNWTGFSETTGCGVRGSAVFVVAAFLHPGKSLQGAKASPNVSSRKPHVTLDSRCGSSESRGTSERTFDFLENSCQRRSSHIIRSIGEVIVPSSV